MIKGKRKMENITGTLAFCPKCKAVHNTDIIWIKFYRKTGKIETCFICFNCKEEHITLDDASS